MADASTVQELVDYYVNLLIIQYHNKPKARAHIALLASVLLANGVFFDVLDGYNIDNAVGVQLDVIGKYIGVDRFYRDLELIDYFSMPGYFDSKTSPPQYGFETYATFATDNDFNGTLLYDDIIAVKNQLLDDTYRILLKLKILINTMNYSTKAIDDAMVQFFGTTVRVEDNGLMHLAYFVTSTVTTLIQAVLYKKLLPKPMAVGAAVVSDVKGLMFGMADYSGDESIYAHGFSTYATYATLTGQTLEYNQVTEG